MVGTTVVDGSGDTSADDLMRGVLANATVASTFAAPRFSYTPVGDDRGAWRPAAWVQGFRVQGSGVQGSGFQGIWAARTRAEAPPEHARCLWVCACARHSCSVKCRAAPSAQWAQLTHAPAVKDLHRRERRCSA